MIGPRVLDPHDASRDRAGNEIGPAFDSIRQHFVRSAAQALDALHDDLVGARALDLGPHRDEKIRKIDDFRLTGGVFEDRLAVGQSRRHHQVFRSRHGDCVQHETGAFEPAGACADVTTFDGDVCAHRLKAGDVNVHGTRTDRTAAGQRHVSLAEASQKRSQHQNRSAHRLHELVGCEALLHG